MVWFIIILIPTNRQNKRRKVYLSDKLHPQTLAVVKTRALPLGLEVLVGDAFEMDFSGKDVSCVVVQYPDTEGSVEDFASVINKAKENGVSGVGRVEQENELRL